MTEDAELAALMTTLDAPSFFASRAPALDTIAAPELASELPPSIAEAIAREGWCACPSVLYEQERSAITECIDALARESLPPLFVYAYSATWRIGARVARALSGALGAPYDLIEDAWAFRVPVGPAHAGWVAHRGSYDLARDRRAPDSLNVWIAITEATVDNSCMYVVPLDRDPGYPDDLRSHAGVSEGIALPVPAGTALVWNANVLHWGGPSTERAEAPRTSITFTLRRDAPPPRIGDHAQRLDVIADQILTYGHLERTLSPRLRRWAELRVGMRNLLRGRADDPSRKGP